MKKLRIVSRLRSLRRKYYATSSPLSPTEQSYAAGFQRLAAYSEESSSLSNNRVVVVVSTDRVIRGRIRLWLSQMGFQTLTAPTMVSAVNLLQNLQQIPLCVILDQSTNETESLEELQSSTESATSETNVKDFPLFARYPLLPVLTLERSGNKELRRKALRQEFIPVAVDIRRKDFKGLIGEILSWSSTAATA